MRFEVRAAFVFGIALPVLEAARRRTSFHPLPAYLDDFVIGGILLVAAWSVTRGKTYGPALLACAWGTLCGGLWASFFGQLASTDPTDISGLPNGVVVGIKGVAYAVALFAAFLAVRSAAGERT